jgi:23S rRNA pseudouridine1911/1915/1917 synthase
MADAAYGGTRREGRLVPEDPVRLAASAVGRQALHAWKLSFRHPRTGRLRRFEAPVPPEMLAAMDILRRA